MGLLDEAQKIAGAVAGTSMERTESYQGTPLV